MKRELIDRLMKLRAEIEAIEDELIGEDRGEFLAGHMYCARKDIDALVGEYFARAFANGQVTFNNIEEEAD